MVHYDTREFSGGRGLGFCNDDGAWSRYHANRPVADIVLAILLVNTCVIKLVGLGFRVTATDNYICMNKKYWTTVARGIRKGTVFVVEPLLAQSWS